ncbi:MAG: glucose-1-phosphate adenylyltransferase subunit GlgD [Candidatus Limivicinus sp.]|jgi:glucose-1-phosphate adenylyltransferase
MDKFHGIIFAYSAYPELGTLVKERNAASLPYGGRYRLIDFALSSLRNAGVRNVGVILKKNYQSLLDHMGSGKAWDMSRRSGGLRILPPFGMPEYHQENYVGTVEALNAVVPYIRDIQEEHVVLMLGNLCANIDLRAAMVRHLESGADMTAICADYDIASLHNRYVVDENGYIKQILFDRSGGAGLASLECYIIRKETLLKLMDQCRALNLYHFHGDAVANFLDAGGRMACYIHPGYARAVHTTDDYYTANMDMLNIDVRNDLFSPDKPVRTRKIEGVSTYYGEKSVSRNSLVADNCIVEGEIENCILFSGARIAAGARLKNCIVMSDCTVEKGAQLNYVIADKSTYFSKDTVLTGNPKLPVVVPKGSRIYRA